MKRTALVALLFMLTGCTLARYKDQDGRDLLVADFRLAGSAVDVSITRPDGTKIEVTRDQASPEQAIEAIGDAVNPVRFP